MFRTRMLQGFRLAALAAVLSPPSAVRRGRTMTMTTTIATMKLASTVIRMDTETV